MLQEKVKVVCRREGGCKQRQQRDALIQGAFYPQQVKHHPAAKQIQENQGKPSRPNNSIPAKPEKHQVSTTLPQYNLFALSDFFLRGDQNTRLFMFKTHLYVLTKCRKKTSKKQSEKQFHTQIPIWGSVQQKQNSLQAFSAAAGRTMPGAC